MSTNSRSRRLLYSRLLQLRQVQELGVLKLRNHYFDTKDFKLYDKKTRLRFRLTNKTEGEVTLKIPSKKVVNTQHPPKIRREITAPLEVTDLLSMVKGEMDVELPEEILEHLPVATRKLNYLGQIKTKRSHVRLPSGLVIEVDKAKILDETIYEIEIEIQPSDDAEGIFRYVTRFLQQNQIEYEPTDVSKSKRFFAKLMSL
ncbi:MAG: CYTH domain-containing protein [Bdellovibrionota bacterium]